DSSPSKRPAHSKVVAVDMGELQRLLHEQGEKIMKAQHEHLEARMGALEELTGKRMTAAEGRLGGVEGKVEALEQKLEDLVKKIDSGAAASRQGPAETDRCLTLVYGGWQRDTRRGELLNGLNKCLRELELDALVDYPPFCTGPRRSTALSVFKVRDGESEYQVKRRMHHIIIALRENEVRLPGGKRMYAMYSKSKEEREIASMLRGSNGRSGKLPRSPWTCWTWSTPRVECGVVDDEDVMWGLGSAWVLPGQLARELGISVGALKGGGGGTRRSCFPGMKYRAEKPGGNIRKLRGGGVSHIGNLIMRKRSAGRGSWFRLRHVHGQEIWVGVAHFTPGSTQPQHAAEVNEFLQGLPSTHLPVMVGCDVNAQVDWVGGELDSALAVGLNGKTAEFLSAAQERAMAPIPPLVGQRGLPTSRPRQAGREGKHIDVVLSARIRTGEVIQEVTQGSKARGHSNVVDDGEKHEEAVEAAMGAGKGALLGFYNGIFESVFNRMLLARTLPYIGVVAAKIDITKAYDMVNRPRLLQKLLGALGDGPVYRCWQALLSDTWAILMDTQRKHSWADRDQVFPSLCLEELLFMDDGVLWSGSAVGLSRKLEEWTAELREYGPSLNAAKCKVYFSPYAKGSRIVKVQGILIPEVAKLEVMGIPFRVGAPPAELLAPLISRAKDKFWSIKHLLRARTPLAGRVIFLDRVIGGTVLWCLSALAPDSNSMLLLNSLELQCVVSCMRVGIQTAGLSWCPPGGMDVLKKALVYMLAGTLVELLGTQGERKGQGGARGSNHH
ncbi:pol, partial [Symbiodinium sp. CCMP2456]